MGKKSNYYLFAAIVLLMGVAICYVASKVVSPTSKPGHFFRWLHGEAGALQKVNDMTSELKGSAFVQQLQDWSIESINRFNLGEISTNKDDPDWPIHAVVLSQSEVPDFLRKKWNTPPQVSMCLSTNGRAQSVVVDWYLYGIVIGPSNSDKPFYDLLYNKPIEPLYKSCVQPGVYVIWFDTK